MSNTAAAAMMLPIALGVMGVVGGMVAKQAGGDKDPERLRFGAALMLVITYGITVGGLLLPIGSPPNLIGRELLEEETGEPITFVEWFVMALPIVLVMFVAVMRDRHALQPARGQARGGRGGVRGRGARQARAAHARREEHAVRARASRWWAGSCPASWARSWATTRTPTRR